MGGIHHQTWVVDYWHYVELGSLESPFSYEPSLAGEVPRRPALPWELAKSSPEMRPVRAGVQKQFGCHNLCSFWSSYNMLGQHGLTVLPSKNGLVNCDQYWSMTINNMGSTCANVHSLLGPWAMCQWAQGLHFTGRFGSWSSATI